MIIIFLGPPFSGKSLQANLLAEELDIHYFSMGQIIREAYRRGNPKAIEGFEKYSLKGLHLPISLKFDLLKEELKYCNGSFILDNFPATVEDLNALLPYLKERKLSIDKVFYLKVTEEDIQKRLSSRCRKDDKPEILMKRIKEQGKDIVPVLDYFKNKGILEEINATADIVYVHNMIKSKLDLT